MLKIIVGLQFCMISTAKKNKNNARNDERTKSLGSCISKLKLRLIVFNESNFSVEYSRSNSYENGYIVYFIKSIFNVFIWR